MNNSLKINNNNESAFSEEFINSLQNVNNDIDNIFSEEFMQNFKSDYKLRPSQVEAANIIYKTLSKNGINITEGPCGFGKTFAYLIPVLTKIEESDFNKKALIVTDGISLQHQLSSKDLPVITNILSNYFEGWNKDKFKATLLKGKQNFVCLKKANELFDDNFNIELAGLGGNKDRLLEFQGFLKNTKTGDLEELSYVPDKEFHELVSCTKPRECLGKKCNNYSRCYYMRHKSDLEFSNVIITNYHMYFSNLSIGGSIIPRCDYVIFDEAHKMANIFRDFNHNICSKFIIDNIRNKFSEIFNSQIFSSDNELLEIGDERLISNIDSIRETLIYAGSSFSEKTKIEVKEIHDRLSYEFTELARRYSDLEVNEPKLINDLSECKINIAEFVESTDKLLELNRSISNMLSAISPEDADQAGVFAEPYLKMIYKLGNVCETINDSCYKLLELFDCGNKDVDNTNIVKWIVKESSGFVSINLKPVDVGKLMSELVFDTEMSSFILTSATLSVDGNFQYMKEQLGLTDYNCITEFIGQSPFDLTSNQLWYLPKDAVKGNSREFSYSLSEQVGEIIDATHGGALVLFTSIRNMDFVYNKLRYRTKFRILKQGDMPKGRLLKEFAEDKDSVLLASKSFFTGIDIKGDSLRCVVIDKLPFPQFNDPVQQFLSNRENSFFKYSIPEMIIDLKQAVGRGVRSIDDKCVIAFLDNRLATAGYKGKIARSFPYKKTVTRDSNVVEEFLNK